MGTSERISRKGEQEEELRGKTQTALSCQNWGSKLQEESREFVNNSDVELPDQSDCPGSEDDTEYALEFKEGKWVEREDPSD